MNKGVLSSLICGFILGGGVVNFLRLVTECHSSAGAGISFGLFLAALAYFVASLMGVFND